MIHMAAVDVAHEETIRALITATGIIVAAICGLMGIVIKTSHDAAKTRTNSEKIRAQVENSHETNLREESDERHGENSKRLSSLERNSRSTSRQIASLTKGITRIEDALGIERTQPILRKPKR